MGQRVIPLLAPRDRNSQLDRDGFYNTADGDVFYQHGRRERLLPDQGSRNGGAHHPAAEQGHGLHRGRTKRLGPHRPAAPVISTLEAQVKSRLRSVSAPAGCAEQEHLPDRAARSQRGAVLPAAFRAPARDDSDRQRSDGRHGDAAVSSRVPASQGRVSLHRSSGRHRGGIRESRRRTGRYRLDPGDRCRANPRARRLGRGRHRNLDRQAGDLYGSSRNRSHASDSGDAGCRH